ncbi:MAG: DUF417 family protein [Ktedonobacteraceae bacterium]|nr:DUF417 family protein [Ktedonobacteraceae bacterium]
MDTQATSQSQVREQFPAGIYQLVQVVAPPFLRITLGIVFLWMGVTKFFDPGPVVGTLAASYSCLASDVFVYILGGLEVLAALLLFIGRGLRYVGVLILLFFVGTLSIFFIESPSMYAEVGFPALNVVGEFFVKDVSLVGVALMIIAGDVARQAKKQER